MNAGGVFLGQLSPCLEVAVDLGASFRSTRELKGGQDARILYDPLGYNPQVVLILGSVYRSKSIKLEIGHQGAVLPHKDAWRRPVTREFTPCSF